MKIGQYIQDKWLERLGRTGVLVVYDPARRYRDLCLALRADKREVVDASESSIESRELAMANFQKLGIPTSGVASLIVYVPAARPLSDEERQRDPFAVYVCCGSEFPEGDGDEYLNLCLNAKPDYATEIRKAFANDAAPSLHVIDTIGGGTGWPNLRALLHVESARDILFALLCPSETQKTAINTQEAWVTEAKELLQACFGVKLITKGKKWASISDELWRLILFSEFAFDLPGELPASLANMPRATAEAQSLVEDLCDNLRNDRRTQSAYIDRAEAIEKELALITSCTAIKDFGVRDTFPFEERWFLGQTAQAIQTDDIDRVRSMLSRHQESVWMGRGESQAQWEVIRTAVALLEACADSERQLPEHVRSQATLIDFYTAVLREVDRHHREFEQVAGDLIDLDGVLDSVVTLARKRYQGLMADVQMTFVKHLEKEGWPPAGRLSNSDVFDKLVGPKLQTSGRRVAYILVDALRLELGIALERQLAAEGKVTLHVAFAQLPTITPIGMASLLPKAGQDLKLMRRNDEVVAVLGETTLTNVTQRMALLRDRYGERFAEAPLTDFVRGKVKVAETVELLVLRTNEIDSQLESSPDTALNAVHDALKRLRGAVYELKKRGFHEVVVATDHGFFVNLRPEPGDGCTKPGGTWINVHDRSLLGAGTADLSNFVVQAANVGIRGDFAQLAGPRSMSPYRTGQVYLHGGASLQEAVVPVIELKLDAATGPAPAAMSVRLNYKEGAKRITTRLPVLKISVVGGDLFSGGVAVELLVEAHDKQGNVVGEPKPGAAINPATGTISLHPGETSLITIKMHDEFEGKFSIKAMDAGTLATYDKMDLETDYTV
jgi:hypothetical protein